MNLHALTNEILEGRRLSPSDADELELLKTTAVSSLCREADLLRHAYRKNHADLCMIINGRSGRCSENCRFCAQSSHYNTTIDTYPFLSKDVILADGLHADQRGIHRYSIVTAGRTLDGPELEQALEAYRTLARQTRLHLCASLGLLPQEAFNQLKASGVTRYHANLETSRRFFPSICTTHTYEDKLLCIQRAKKAGLEICSGGIIGLGETMDDRIDLAFELSSLRVDSIPLNILIPIPGTPLMDMPPLPEEEILRTIAIFRFIYPEASLRIAGGRKHLSESGKQAFCAGADAAITGDMLTTSGSTIQSDQEMLSSLGYRLQKTARAIKEINL